MRPYSMPLWTILTKWPAPAGPQCRYPCSAVPGSPSRLAEPGCRCVPEDCAHAILREEPAVLFGREEAGDDRVDPDVVRRKLSRQVPRDDVDTGLRDRVGQDARQRDLGRRRRDVDDRSSLPALDHGAAEDLAG